MKISLEDIFNIFATKGHAQYGGEPISQLEHGLQCATLAREHSASPELITACLLHDLGHLLHDLGENPSAQALDDRHEYESIAWLEPLFSAAVTEPIRLHVEAKRYLCVVDAVYRVSLSANSETSLTLQGGIFSAAEAAAFITKPYTKDAVRLRIWDDRAKVPGLKTPGLESFVDLAKGCLQ